MTRPEPTRSGLTVAATESRALPQPDARSGGRDHLSGSFTGGKPRQGLTPICNNATVVNSIETQSHNDGRFASVHIRFRWFPTSPRLAATVLAASCCLAVAKPAHADENYFGYSYGAETLPKGKWEAYLWLTSRVGKGVGTYQAWDNFNEIEHGLTDKLQVSFYANTSGHRIKNNGEFADNSSFGFEGVRTSFKYAVTSPFKSPLGVAIYVEPEYSRRHKISGENFTEYALETKLLLQRNFMDDQLVSVFNFTYEHEFEKEKEAAGLEEEFEQEAAIEMTWGLSYRFRPNWFIGGEGRTHAEYPDADLGNREHRAWFAGPTLHYGGRKWWFTATVLPQVFGTPHENSKHLFLGEHERVETRIKIGYNF